MQHLNTHTDRFSIRGFESTSKIPKSTICSALTRLQDKELITKPHYGHYTITTQGKHLIEMSDVHHHDGRGGRQGNLNMHRIEYSVKIKEGDWEKVGKKANKILTRHMQNWTQRDFFFDAGTIRINTKKAILYIHELEGHNQDHIMEQSNDTAFEYVQLLEDAGFTCEQMRFDGAHWARIKSVFAEVLVQQHGKFRLTLPNGKHFWVDSSEGLEDETSDPLFRERIDDFLSDLSVSSSLFSDVDGLKELMGKTLLTIQTTNKQIEILAQSQQATTENINRIIKVHAPCPSLVINKGVPEYIG